MSSTGVDGLGSSISTGGTTDLVNINFKDELLLTKDDFNQPKTIKNLEALAQTIQNLMFIEKGTFPNQPLMGIGIENYEFEFIDSITLMDLQDNINNQIKTYIPTDEYISCKVSTITNSEKKNVVFINFTVKESKTGDSSFIIAFVKYSKKVLSKIII